MMDNTHPLAFAAIWHNKASEYRATRQEQEITSARIESAFSRARERGIRMLGRYGCRWSTERQYFTFWFCPNFEVLEASIDDLEVAGDFKFADSEHIIGSRMRAMDASYEQTLAKDIPDKDRPYGFLAMWRRTNAYYRSSKKDRKIIERSLSQTLATARSRGVRMFGNCDCRWSTEWERFTFWRAPSLEVLEMTMESLESAGRFLYLESRHLIGELEPIFRFGRHLVADKV